MASRLSIGDFSRIAHLSIKTLRHYDEVGLLSPVAIDERTGYRYYASEQLPQAQVIRRLRALDLPVAEVKRAIESRDPAARSALLSGHLAKVEQQLAHAQETVEFLRAILERPGGSLTVTHRADPGTAALAISAVIDLGDISVWWHGAIAELQATLRAKKLRATGPISGIYAPELFQEERGEATVYLPVPEGESIRTVGRVASFRVAPAELAVLTHVGPHENLDITYGHLAEHVARREIAVVGPIREHYLRGPSETPDPRDWLTEVGWPIFSVRGTE